MLRSVNFSLRNASALLGKAGKAAGVQSAYVHYWGHTMKAVEISQSGPPNVLRLCDRPMPQLKTGEVLIRVHGAGVNRPDVIQRLGHYPVPPGASDLPGLEIAGEIVDGDLVGSSFKRGDLVCALVQGGVMRNIVLRQCGNACPSLRE